jgi:hypothetical protein
MSISPVFDLNADVKGGDHLLAFFQGRYFKKLSSEVPAALAIIVQRCSKFFRPLTAWPAIRPSAGRTSYLGFWSFQK